MFGDDRRECADCGATIPGPTLRTYCHECLHLRMVRHYIPGLLASNGLLLTSGGAVLITNLAAGFISKIEDVLRSGTIPDRPIGRPTNRRNPRAA